MPSTRCAVITETYTIHNNSTPRSTPLSASPVHFGVGTCPFNSTNLYYCLPCPPLHPFLLYFTFRNWPGKRSPCWYPNNPSNPFRLRSAEGTYTIGPESAHILTTSSSVFLCLEGQREDNRRSGRHFIQTIRRITSCPSQKLQPLQ